MLGMGPEMKIPFPTFGNGNENSIPDFWEREWGGKLQKGLSGRESEAPRLVFSGIPPYPRMMGIYRDIYLAEIKLYPVMAVL